MPPRLATFAQIASLLAASLALAGCDEAKTQQGVAATEPTVTEVSVVTLKPSPRPFIHELPGRIAPTRIAEVRARVSGIVIERAFTQGSTVQAGDVLYRLDPAPFQVDLQAAEAALARAEATLAHATQQAKRYEQLVGRQTVSIADYEKAITTQRESEAEVAARRAEVERAKLNLDYATVRAPISGRVGAALVTEGALVQAQTTNLVTVQQLDPIYADFTQSVGDLRQLKRELENGTLEKVDSNAARIRLEFDDGTVYPHPGKLLFSDASVDPGTGQVTLRGEFPNANHDLLPGMYVRVQIEQAIDSDSLAVPQQAVQRNAAGGSEVFVVGEDNSLVVRPIRTGSVVDDQWIVLDGLKPGERVVAEGFQKISPGMTVKPVPWRKWTRTASGSTTSEAPGDSLTTTR